MHYNYIITILQCQYPLTNLNIWKNRVILRPALSTATNTPRLVLSTSSASSFAILASKLFTTRGHVHQYIGRGDLFCFRASHQNRAVFDVISFEDAPESQLSLSKTECETALRKLCRLSSQGEDPVSAPDFYVVRLDCGALFFIRTKRRDIMSERHF